MLDAGPFRAWESKENIKILKRPTRNCNFTREDMENPPLMVVCDMDRFRGPHEFTGTVRTDTRFRPRRAGGSCQS